MTNSNAAILEVANEEAPTAANNADEVIAGLRQRVKHISPKYFYDQTGSELFDQITELPEYYLTRAELSIMKRIGDELGELVGPKASVIEFGAGSNIKIRMLLDALQEPAAYVPVDISGDYLQLMAESLAADYPDLEILPILADFTQPFALPSPKIEPLRNLVFFPGSTIGNFSPPDAASLLHVMCEEAKSGGALLIGADLKKDKAVLEAAYNDAQGVTAAFNLNVLTHLNRELDGDFDIDQFRHRAIYNETEGCIEMHLVSLRDQDVTLAGERFHFARDEHVVTEYSYKFSLDEFEAMAKAAGFRRQQVWLDDKERFSLQLFDVPN